MMKRESTNSMSCKQRMKKLQAIDFSMDEMVLYLDAYPESADAMRYYNALRAERAQLLSEMKASGCAPIVATDAAEQGRWDWTDAPWPWEPEAN